MPPGRGSSVAFAPFQRTMSAGSVKNAKTVSGLASMWSSRSMTSEELVLASTLLPFLRLRLALELRKAERPEALEELLELLQTFRTGAVKALRALTPLAHETGLLEYTQVLGDRGPGHVEAGGDLACRQLAFADQLEDLPPPRFGQRLDGRLHGVTVTGCLRKYKLTSQ